MTVIDEIKQNPKYHRMEFVEFLEFIGRLAHIRYKADLESNLSDKMEIILDEVFAGFGLTFNEVLIEIEEYSESDEDY